MIGDDESDIENVLQQESGDNMLKGLMGLAKYVLKVQPPCPQPILNFPYTALRASRATDREPVGV